MTETFFHKAADMTLLDYFAVHAPKPSTIDVDLERSKDLNESRKNDRFIARNDITIECELRYKWAKEMLKARR